MINSSLQHEFGAISNSQNRQDTAMILLGLTLLSKVNVQLSALLALILGKIFLKVGRKLLSLSGMSLTAFHLLYYLLSFLEVDICFYIDDQCQFPH